MTQLHEPAHAGGNPADPSHEEIWSRYAVVRSAARAYSPRVASTVLRIFVPSSTSRSMPSVSVHRKLLDPLGTPSWTSRWSAGSEPGDRSVVGALFRPMLSSERRRMVKRLKETADGLRQSRSLLTFHCRRLCAGHLCPTTKGRGERCVWVQVERTRALDEHLRLLKDHTSTVVAVTCTVEQPTCPVYRSCGA